jgi:dinuclear metal center YbgI/SA1388 family protein
VGVQGAVFIKRAPWLPEANKMVSRDELSRFLADLYQYQNFEDYCENGLQVEGKEKIESIVFGVSFNRPFLEKAMEQKPDAIIVHHGIFQQGVFKLTGMLKQRVKMLLDHDISLFGIHLPMDSHPELGHNALLLKTIHAQDIEPFELGFRGKNVRGYSLDHILEIFHRELHPQGFAFAGDSAGDEHSIFSLSKKHGFLVLENGPKVPGTIAVIAGASSGSYEKALEEDIDTFFCGDIKEHIPAFSYESRTNFVDLGHYYSEKPGVLALKGLIAEKFAVQTEYIEIPNPV